MSSPALPAHRDQVAWSLAHASVVDESLKERVRELVLRLPDAETLCHGDFHPENILLTQRGPVVIDWEGCTRGSPAADVARTCLWIRSALMFGTGLLGWVLRQVGRRFERSYLMEYERLAPGCLGDLDRWIAVLAACHAREDARDQFAHLLALIERGLLAA